MDVVVSSAARFQTLRPLQFLISVGNGTLSFLLYYTSKKMDEELRFLPRASEQQKYQIILFLPVFPMSYFYMYPGVGWRWHVADGPV